MICPLCAAGGAELFFADTAVARADFFHCSHCDLIFKSPDSHLDALAERNRYALHNNVSGDAGYARWLKPAVDAVLASCSVGASGLDYGCGPGPVLSELLRDLGFAMSVYDPFFAKNESVLAQHFNFVTCTEVAEHFYKPADDFKRLVALLRPRGHLILMTGFHRGREAFKTWHYRIDPTHVCFYSRTALEWIACEHNLSVEFASAPVTLATFKLMSS